MMAEAARVGIDKHGSFGVDHLPQILRGVPASNRKRQ